MKNDQNGGTFFFGIIAVILGVTLFKHFDFENMTYPKPWLGAVYLITFLFSVYFLFKSRSKQ